MAVATVFGAQSTLLTGNSGGGLQSLPAVNLVGGKVRLFIERVTLASSITSGTVIMVARLPLPFVLVSIAFLTDTSLGSTTIAIGNANSTANYVAAQTLTTTNQKVAPTGLVTANFGTQINTGYDGTTGNAVTAYAPGQGGAGYEDILLTTAAATAPSSGNLVLFFEYTID